MKRASGSRPVRGFSLIELLVVMLVLGILAAAAMPMAELMVQRERERELKHALREIRGAIDAYKRAVDLGQIVAPAGASGYPPTLEALVVGVPDQKAAGQMRVFLRRIPADPFAEPEQPAARTWRLRSYASPHDRPEPGADVYDVGSRSPLIGLNGVPLKDW